MKRLFPFVLLITAAFAILSCEKETLLIIDQTSLAFPDAGGTSTIALTANKPWTASSDQSWCSVSPASGEDVSGSKINIRCDANPDYDGRNCTITFTCEEKVTVVSVSQSNASGLFVTTPGYELSNEKHTLAVEVKANVEYEVMSEADWIHYAGTKGLTTSQIILEIDANESFDGREGKVSVKQKNGGLSGTITIKQDSSKGLFVTPTEYNLSNESQTIEVEVKYNVEFSTVIPAECQDWISIAGTKSLAGTVYSIHITENNSYENRVGSITFKQKDGSLSATVQIEQMSLDPAAVIVDLSEDTGRNESLVMLEDGSYWVVHSVEGETYESLYYNHSVENDIADGLFFLLDRKDGSILIDLPEGKKLMLVKAGENIYNMAIMSDGHANILIGLEASEDWSSVPAVANSSVMTKALSEDQKHIVKSALLKLAYFTGNALSVVTLNPSALANLGITVLFETYKSDWFNIQERLSDYHVSQGAVRGAENGMTAYNIMKGFPKWKPFSEGLFTMNQLQAALSILNTMADEELAMVGVLKEDLAPALGDEWNIKLSPQFVTCQGSSSEYIVEVSSKAMWTIDDSTVDHSWCDVRRVDDHIVVSVAENHPNGQRSCFATVKGSVNSDIYYITPVKLYITQHDYKMALSEKELVFGRKGGSKPVQVDYSENIKSWKVTQWPEWCTIDQQETWNYRATTFWVNVNASEVGHEPASIIVTGYLESGGYIDVSVSVRQDVSEDYELRENLIKFYKETGGPNWKRNDNWCSDKPLDEWYGLTYNSNNPSVEINLRHNNMTGDATIINCDQITKIDIVGNSVTTLNVASCHSLNEIACADNQICSLIASDCIMLNHLWCSRNLIQVLDLSNCHTLKELNCDYNELQSLDLNNCSSLEVLFCGYNHLQSLEVSNCTSLKSLYGWSNPSLQSLNISNCISLIDLNCSENQLLTLDVSGCISLESLDCSVSKINTLDLSGCKSLKYLSCSYCENLHYLNLYGCRSLIKIDCGYTQLQSINVSDIRTLEVFVCANNHLQSLDIKNCSSLKNLDCSNNYLESLDITTCVSLKRLDCTNNQLNSLSISNCPSLEGLFCKGNHITQKITNEDHVRVFWYDQLYNYWQEWDNTLQSMVNKWKKNDYGWYYEGEPEKGYHGR